MNNSMAHLCSIVIDCIEIIIKKRKQNFFCCCWGHGPVIKLLNLCLGECFWLMAKFTVSWQMCNFYKFVEITDDAILEVCLFIFQSYTCNLSSNLPFFLCLPFLSLHLQICSYVPTTNTSDVYNNRINDQTITVRTENSHLQSGIFEKAVSIW